jgi:hypothetical protein
VAAEPDAWDQGGTYTREQLEQFRGPLTPVANGLAKSVAPTGTDSKPASNRK